MSLWKRKKKERWSERRIEAYRLTPSGYERSKRQDNPVLSYEGGLILSLLKDGRHTVGEIADRCAHATGSYVRREVERLISLGLVVRDDIIERSRLL